jgi:hypothetical protein
MSEEREPGGASRAGFRPVVLGDGGVMDQFTRRIIGFAVRAGVLDGPAVCRMFNHAIAGALTLPRHLRSDVALFITVCAYDDPS